jgi:hypothetical protein
MLAGIEDGYGDVYGMRMSRRYERRFKRWTSFSVLPLRIISFTGIAVSVAALTYLIIVLLKALIFGDPVGGYPSMMCIILFLGGFVLLALGIIGEYLGIIYRETKKRPYYFVNEVKRVNGGTEEGGNG